MGTSTEELKRDIETSRNNLGETLDAIGDRVSPGRMMERRRQRVRDRVTNVRWRVMGGADRATSAVGDATSSATDTVRHTPEALRGQTQGSPLAAGAIAAGAGFLVGALMRPSETEMHTASTIMDKAAPLRDELKNTGEQMAESLKHDAGEAVDELKHSASEGAERVRDTAKHQST
jgi:ElaB/YqjD/DUF883 family membrane-anchored ribosome-binding protein